MTNLFIIDYFGLDPLSKVLKLPYKAIFEYPNYGLDTYYCKVKPKGVFSGTTRQSPARDKGLGPAPHSSSSYSSVL